MLLSPDLELRACRALCGDLKGANGREHRRRREGEAPERDGNAAAPPPLSPLIEFLQERVQNGIEASNGWELDRMLERAMDALRCPDPDSTGEQNSS
eukprot:755029-Hanusia_phi.AAC.20